MCRGQISSLDNGIFFNSINSNFHFSLCCCHLWDTQVQQRTGDTHWADQPCLDSSHCTPWRAPVSWEEADPCEKSHKRNQRHRGALLGSVILREDSTGWHLQHLQKWRKCNRIIFLVPRVTKILSLSVSLSLSHYSSCLTSPNIKKFSTWKFLHVSPPSSVVHKAYKKYSKASAR